MSAGLTGQECTVWARGALAQGASGGTKRAWSSLATAQPLAVQKMSAGWALRQFGVKDEARFLGQMDGGVDLGVGDVLQITAGRYTGEYLEVASLEEGEQDWAIELKVTSERPS